MVAEQEAAGAAAGAQQVVVGAGAEQGVEEVVGAEQVAAGAEEVVGAEQEAEEVVGAEQEAEEVHQQLSHETRDTSMLSFHLLWQMYWD